MKIQKNTSLKPYNTFGIDVKASRFIDITAEELLCDVLDNEKDIFVLSGGSNILLTQDIDTLVVYINIKGIEIINEDKNTIDIAVNAGEDWHEFVLWCIENNYGGIENLALIPGKVGTSPIQNIGAYGVEVKDTIKEVHAVNRSTGKKEIFNNSDCQFAYRNSIFKGAQKDKYIITRVVFTLTKNDHNINMSYGVIEERLLEKNISTPTIKDIANTVISIRQQKLPDPKELGNSGSFFKNPVVDKTLFNDMYTLYPKMPFYKTEDMFKIPAGWLIEQCGFKGKRFGDAGVHKNQALVLVNYGNATGKEIFALSQTIVKEVKDRFNITLETEVNII